MDDCPPDDDEFSENWTQLCKRTEDPKLAWLERQLTAAGLRHGRSKFPSFHAPRLLVHPEDEDKALEILLPVDDIPDDDPRFQHLE